jgi:hypothetical protein
MLRGERQAEIAIFSHVNGRAYSMSTTLASAPAAAASGTTALRSGSLKAENSVSDGYALRRHSEVQRFGQVIGADRV